MVQGIPMKGGASPSDAERSLRNATYPENRLTQIGTYSWLFARDVPYGAVLIHCGKGVRYVDHRDGAGATAAERRGSR